MIRKETFKTRAEWLERRESRPVLGSSDFGVILGLSEYVTPLQYWERKMKGSDEMNANMHRGIFMEDAIAKWFESETGCEIIKRSASYDVYTNDEFPDFVECSPDREAFRQEWEDRPVVEIKDTKRIIDDMDADSIPKEWYAQVQFQMAVMGRKNAFLVICDGRKELKYGHYTFDKDWTLTNMRKATDWFHKHIIGGEQPEPTTAQDIRETYPESKEGIVRVGKDMFSRYERLGKLNKAIKVLEREKKEIEGEIILRFGEQDSMEYEGTTIATFKSYCRKKLDTEMLRLKYPNIVSECTVESSYRMLKFK